MTWGGLFTTSALLLCGTAASAQQVVATSASPPNGTDSADIIVTGTRSAQRTAAQSTAPVDVVSARQLAVTPALDLNDQLAQNIPSFVVQRMPGIDGVNFVRPATLRGLSPDETLVLVDGHRRHRSAFIDIVNQGAEPIDLAQIPDAAIGHVEVLRDGASAQYGSDAIAGVINVILDDRPGTSLTAESGSYYAGDGISEKLLGKSGWALPGGGILVVSGEFLHAGATDRSVGVRNKIGQPDLASEYGSYNLKEPLGETTWLYSFGTIAHSKAWSDFSYRSATNGDAAFARSFYQDGPDAIDPTWNLASLYPDGFIPQIGSVTLDAEAVAGVKHEAGPFSIDLSGRYGRNGIDYKVRHSANPTLGPTSPTYFDAGQLIASEASANLDIVYKLDAGLAKPINIAFGAEHRYERYQIKAGDAASFVVGPLADLPSGSYGFPGLSAQSAGTWGRHSDAGYFDIEAEPLAGLELGAAGRYEHYSDFGSNFSYKFSGRYALTSRLALRATYNTGFRAPTPGQQHFTTISSSPDATQPKPYPIVLTALVSPTDPLAIRYGGAPLKPEQSRNISAGVVFRAASSTTLTVDYYHIHIADRIGLTPEIDLPPGTAAFEKIRFLINGYSTNSDGVDVVASTHQRALGGQVTLTGSFNYNRTRIGAFDPVLVNDVLRDEVERQRPRYGAIGSAEYDRGHLHLTGRVRYYGAYYDALPGGNPFPSQRISPLAMVDLDVSYDVTDRLTMTAGAENLFNTYPDRTKTVEAFIGFKYPLIQPYDGAGGRAFARATYRF
jgi:iron complex outermembrane receptor protein